MPKSLFGTDGIRGVPGTPPLDDATLFATGHALGAYLHREHSAARVLIGMDTRESGPHIASVLASGLTQAGASVAFAGVITTPGVACLVRQNDFEAGVVISASHNPFHDNGVKLFSHAGMKFPDATEEVLEQEIIKYRDENKFARISAAALVADQSLDAEYLANLRGRTIPGAKLNGFRVVLDCANGAAFKLGPELFRSLGAEVISIGDSPDGRNDGVMLAAARFLKSQNKLKGDRVVGTSMSNLGLERVLGAEGITLARADVGDRYVLEEMLRSGSVLGGEQSGHIIFLDDSPAGDGLLTALKIASLVSMSGGLTDLTKGLKDYPQIIVNVKVRSKPPLDSLPEVSRALSDANSVLGKSGRIVLRYSGTEPLARVMVEAEHDADVQRFSESLANAVRASIGA